MFFNNSIRDYDNNANNNSSANSSVDDIKSILSRNTSKSSLVKWYTDLSKTEYSSEVSIDDTKHTDTANTPDMFKVVVRPKIDDHFMVELGELTTPRSSYNLLKPITHNVDPNNIEKTESLVKGLSNKLFSDYRMLSEKKGGDDIKTANKKTEETKIKEQQKTKQIQKKNVEKDIKKTEELKKKNTLKNIDNKKDDNKTKRKESLKQVEKNTKKDEQTETEIEQINKNKIPIETYVIDNVIQYEQVQEIIKRKDTIKSNDIINDSKRGTLPSIKSIKDITPRESTTVVIEDVIRKESLQIKEEEKLIEELQNNVLSPMASQQNIIVSERRKSSEHDDHGKRKSLRYNSDTDDNKYSSADERTAYTTTPVTTTTDYTDPSEHSKLDKKDRKTSSINGKPNVIKESSKQNDKSNCGCIICIIFITLLIIAGVMIYTTGM